MNEQILPSVTPSALNPTGSNTPLEIMERKAKQRVALVEARERLERLLASDDFLWYQAFVGAGIDAMKVKAGDIDARTPEQRDAYTQRFLGIESLLHWPAKQLQAAIEGERRLDEELRKMSDPAAAKHHPAT